MAEETPDSPNEKQTWEEPVQGTIIVQRFHTSKIFSTPYNFI